MCAGAMCSATGRGTTRDPKDFYPTPWPAFGPLLPYLPFNISFWEPCAGDGRVIGWLRKSGRDANGCDLYPQINPYYPAGGSIDYLKDYSQRDFVITNPPFSLAFEMCQHALKYSREFMFLLRLSFLESEERGDWLSKNEPYGLWVLRKRPSFVMSVTCKTTPTEEEAWRQKTVLRLPCNHNWLLPIEAERPKACPKCGGTKLVISTSDNSGYMWAYWGWRATLFGIHHI